MGPLVLYGSPDASYPNNSTRQAIGVLKKEQRQPGLTCRATRQEPNPDDGVMPDLSQSYSTQFTDLQTAAQSARVRGVEHIVFGISGVVLGGIALAAAPVTVFAGLAGATAIAGGLVKATIGFVESAAAASVTPEQMSLVTLLANPVKANLIVLGLFAGAPLERTVSLSEDLEKIEALGVLQENAATTEKLKALSTLLESAVDEYVKEQEERNAFRTLAAPVNVAASPGTLAQDTNSDDGEPADDWDE